MGPLAPFEIISENTNFLLAFFIGIAFGWVLESSGFSSSRKLAGIFYGYDTVVLKVFFTGAITAMLGLLFMSLFGWVDLDLVYVNPTYLTSAIIGGVVMGAGFIMGGFCPGTSFCGAAIGKIDAMVFIGGLFIVETGSVILQRLYFKITKGRRIFLMSPIHHHFELKGWAETTVVVRFWLVAGFFVCVAIGAFYGEWLLAQ